MKKENLYKEVIFIKNKELLNICYKFFNRFLTADSLIEELSNIDKESLKNEDIKETNKLIEEIKKVAINNPNKEDEYVLKKKESIKRVIEKLEKIKENNEYSEQINNRLDKLKKEYESEMDSQERWFKVFECINNNNYFSNTFESLSDYELLEFIAQYIKAPFPPNLTQEEFDKLVKVGIEKDEREWLWRLAFNYEERKLNFDLIVNYYIDKKDGYYISELISAVGKHLNIDNIIDKINDKELIEYLINNKDVISSYVSDEQFNKLINKTK